MSEITKKEERNVPRYRPATDILEREDGFYIYIDLPGVKREDMTIDLQEDELTVTGVSRLGQGEGEHFVEMQFGDSEYVRSISITDIVDRERIKANLENGVLELLLPKVEKTQPKRIEIQAG
ncbi:Hsp20/alpha crystallin family protein [Pseudodesulfovibrio sp.]|uniref:Hsp20/alpha crystallin family protein n=1 Tax=Pseudodesulfovibrio sp. TaxID=2035812 RepID=UPI0026041781|nr:Hsp20/alpha crystallin family protein [Pseudodesulfovibrio sp.]MDD3313652.1 Hsp20/alpha crystallin family protein [Pseudodesulfovibrio sp.]